MKMQNNYDNMEKKPVDKYFYLGRHVNKVNKNSSHNKSHDTKARKTSTKKKMDLITEGNDERVNDMYMHSIKAKLAFLENQKNGIHA